MCRQPLPVLAADIGRQPLGVVAFGKGHRGRYVAELVVLVQQPGLLEVPPLGAVEQVIEAGIAQRIDLLDRAAQRFRVEFDLAVDIVRGVDQVAPDGGGHLIGGVAAEALDAQADVMLHVAPPVIDQTGAGVAGSRSPVPPDRPRW